MRKHAIILIADDDADIRANFSDILSDRGYVVDVAPDGHAALARIKERQYDVAILDFKMPGMDGATLYTSVKKMYPELVAIMVTAYAGSDGAQRALDAGVAHVLRKPVEMSQLLERVEDVLRQPLLLVVDDDQEFCASLWQVLRNRGYRVGLAHDQSGALERFDQRAYDVALIDLRLSPENGGDHLFQQVREKYPGTRTLLITGFRSQFQDRIDGLVSGGAEVFYKPLNLDAMLERIGQLV
jgi:DNA-binding response OmpR family regulator